VLIASPRHTREDLRVWAERERMDRRLARSGALDRPFAMAAQAVADFLDGGPAYVSVSWGKDSTVLADLVLRVAPRTPLIWFAAEGIENPDCALVRDEFLCRWPVRYFEIGVPGDGDPDSWDVSSRSARRISGLRAEESSTRALSAAVHGVATARSCRPLLRWCAEHVYAYLAARDLPVHPAYACSLGGTIDRRHLRVGPLGGERGTGHGRAEWERRYYGIGR
jgi:phosphoadenosine phosphosulfate reductase